MMTLDDRDNKISQFDSSENPINFAIMKSMCDIVANC